MRVKSGKFFGTILGPIEKGGVWLFWDLNPDLCWTENERIEPLVDENGHVVFSTWLQRGPLNKVMLASEMLQSPHL